MLMKMLMVACVALLGSGCARPRGQQLCDAIARRDVVAVREVLSGPQLDATRAYGACVPADVFRSAKTSEPALTAIGIELLNAGLPPDASWTPPGRTETARAIEVAAANGNDELVRALLAVGLSVTSVETTRAFVQAAGAGHLRVVTLLVQEGADLDATSGGETALDRARANDRAEVVKFLEETLAAREAAAARQAAEGGREQLP
jgi:hypothetical protein